MSDEELTLSQAARALAEQAAKEAADFPKHGIYRGIKSAEVSRTMALASIAESLERIGEYLHIISERR